MKTRNPDMPVLSSVDDSPIYRPVAVRCALAAVAVVALLYGLQFTFMLPSAWARAVSCLGFLLVCGLGWAGIAGLSGLSLRRGTYPSRAFLLRAFYFAAIWFYLYFTAASAAGDGVFGFLVLFGLWCAGMIGAVGSLASREARPLGALSLLVFYITAALMVLFWVPGHIIADHPLK